MKNVSFFQNIFQILAKKPPNVIVIVADDMGKHDVSLNGAKWGLSLSKLKSELKIK